MASPSRSLHFILFPLMAPGHMIPMFDIARLLAKHGATVTLITTHLNAARFRSVIDRAVDTGLSIKVIELEFPSTKAGLPEGCENIDMLPTSVDMSVNFFAAMEMLVEPVEKLLEGLCPRPSCIISDMCISYTAEISKKFGVPRVVFHGPGCFYLLCMRCLGTSKVLETVSSDSEYFVLPGLPDRLEFTRLQFPVVSPGSETEKIFNRRKETNLESYGEIVNSFEELEPAYAAEYKRARGGKAWCIGPVSMYNMGRLDIAERGNKVAIDTEACIEWLDLKEPGSVLYACLGSLCNLSSPQLQELAMALEGSGRPFVWAVRQNEQSSELWEWMEQLGFERRVGDRGLVIRGWAPQVLILSHRSVGGFLTHCGWNSTIEGICAGVPMLTWPLFFDQFCNEKLVVEVVGTGVKIGVEAPRMIWGATMEDEGGGSGRRVVERGYIEEAIEKVMRGGEEGEERRRRAKEMGEKAKRAVEEGGSSYLNLTLFIQEIEQLDMQSD
ncbi:hypothetical protein SAY87_007757 [Trapa incisa]|uniref:Glycosyltransferase n=1 Tax=Trapa incisa TaxID=236973 RepID=A0AAN7QIL8_9MYRT|nr:hypothetical protein SAY87_007757 [Trapa incisa]